jgi:hypothetical protein
MSYSYRLSRFAAVGWIAVACVLGGAGVGLALEEVGEEFNPPNERMTIYDPPKASNATEPTYDSRQDSLSSAFPVRIITDSADADATNAREKERDEREKANLEAARKSASEAERAANIADRAEFTAKIATGSSVVGIFLLVWTLYETRKTAKASINSADAAKEAVDIARKAFKTAEDAAVESAKNVETALSTAKITVDQFQRIADATLLQARSFMLNSRPILYPINGVIFRSTGDLYIITYDIYNIGYSIGFVKNIRTRTFERRGTIGNRIPCGEETINDTFFVRSDARLILGRPVRKLKIDEETCNRIINNRLFVIVEGEIIYSDPFDKVWVSTFEFEIVIKSRRGGKLYWVSNGWKNEEVKSEDAKS